MSPVLRGRRWKKGSHQGMTPEELQAMIKACKHDRYAKRNECMLLLGFSFGLRVSELLTLKIADVDLENGQIHLERAKNGKTHDPAISKALQRTLRAYLKDRNGKPSEFLFPSQRNSEKPLSRGFFHKWFSETAQSAGLDVAKQHPASYASRPRLHDVGGWIQSSDHRMALQFYGSVTDDVADRARKEAFAKYSWL